MRYMGKSTFGIGAVLAVLCCWHLAPAHAAVAVQQGELRLDGSVVSYDANGGRLVINATAFTLASGRSSSINPAKHKDIVLSAQTGFMDNAGAKIDKPALKPGQAIAVIGADGGSGNALKARLVIIATAPPQAATPQATADASAKPDQLQPGEFALNGQIKGIFSAESIVIEVFKRIDSAGKEEELGQPVEQKLHLDANTQIFSREDASKTMTLGDIELGQRISVVGKYGGADQPFHVRTMAVWKESEQKLQSIGSIRVHPVVAQLLDKGDAAYKAGAVPESLQYYKKASQTAASVGDAAGNSLAQNSLGLAYGALNQPKLALQAFQTSVSLANGNGDPVSAAIALSNMGDFLQSGGDYKNAVKAYDQALESVTSRNFSGKNRLMFSLTMGKAQALRNLEKLPEAINLMRQAVGLAKQINDTDYQFQSYTTLGFMQAANNNIKEAESNATAAMSLIPQFKDPQQQAHSWVSLYVLYWTCADNKQATHAYEQAGQLLTQLKDTGQLDKLKALKAKLEAEAKKDTKE